MEKIEKGVEVEQLPDYGRDSQSRRAVGITGTAQRHLMCTCTLPFSSPSRAPPLL